MKSPKKPSIPSQDEARRANVLMEKMVSEFRAFGESLSIVRDRVDRMEPDLHKVREDMELLKSVARSHSEDLRVIKSDAASIKTDLKNYNHRLEVVEAKTGS